MDDSNCMKLLYTCYNKCSKKIINVFDELVSEIEELINNLDKEYKYTPIINNDNIDEERKIINEWDIV